MAKIKLTKSAVDAAQPPGAGRRAPGHAGARPLVQDYPIGPQGVHAPVPDERRGAPQASLGPVRGADCRTGALAFAQQWLAQVRRGGDPAADKAEARKAPTVEELRKKLMEDCSKKRSKPSTQAGYQGVIDRNIIPLLGRKKVQDVKRPDIRGIDGRTLVQADRGEQGLQRLAQDVQHG